MRASPAVTVLADNTVRRPGLLGEHGLAYLIELEERRFLFDTGQGLALRHNARALKADLARLDGIILSHGHYDHTLGLRQALAGAGPVPVYAHPHVFQRKLAGDLQPKGTGEQGDAAGSRADSSSRTYRYIGMDLNQDELARLGGAFEPTPRPRELAPGLFVTGEIPRTTDFEREEESFYLEVDGQKMPDPFRDEQAVYLDTAAGVVILLGCSHPGVVNTVRYVKDLTGASRIAAVVGGMHLLHAPEARIERTVAALLELGVERVMPLHCTGTLATALLKAAFKDRCLDGAVGTCLIPAQWAAGR